MKKVLSLFLAFLLVFSFSACSPDENSSNLLESGQESQEIVESQNESEDQDTQDEEDNLIERLKDQLNASREEAASQNEEPSDSSQSEPQADSSQSEPQADSSQSEPQADSSQSEPQADSSQSEPQADSSQSEPQSITVYITETGEKYHQSGCQYLKKSKIAIDLEKAKSQGYTPCSRCNPPA